MNRYAIRTFVFITALVLFGAGEVRAAVTVPGPADSGRIQQNQPLSAPQTPSQSVMPAEQAPPSTLAPEGSDQVRFILKGLVVSGSTVFTSEELIAPYKDKIGQSITLKDIYNIADAIGAKYRDAGYFLSRVEVPDQRINDGVVRIDVTEGYIAKVELQGGESNHVLRGYMDRIIAEKPLTAKTLESALLSLNDLPGAAFRAVLSVMPTGEKGASLLTLIQQKKKVTGSVGFDNYGSQFLGPHEVNATVSGSIAPLNQTTIYGLTSMPTRELGFGTVRHEVTVAPDVTVQAEAGVTRAHPGYTLNNLDIDSTATDVNVSLQYQWMRQRQQNLSSSLTLEGRNVSSDVLNTALTREHIRMLRAHVSYDKTDAWKGSNVANLTLTQGIDGLGSSKSNDVNLSRSEAKPDFTKVELSLARLQELSPKWSTLVQLTGQMASGPMYASEEFGYGGQNYGRAFDASELVGDEGAAASVELRYEGWRDQEPVNLEPYVYYDYGFVTNKDTSQEPWDSAASVGAGVRFVTSWGQNGNIGVAVPVDHNALAPLYAGNHDSPRLTLQFSHNF